MQAEVEQALARLFHAPMQVARMQLLPGGASKEAWLVDAAGADGQKELLLRRAGGGVIYVDTLSLAAEHQVLQAAFAAGVKVPRTYGYIADLAGREAFVMQRVAGESIGRRIVQRPELAAARGRLPLQMAEQLAKIHATPRARLPALPYHGDPGLTAIERMIGRLEEGLDASDEPHPALELGVAWLRRQAPAVAACADTVLVHGDFRIGNLMVDAQGLVAVLDWEFAHLGDPVEDLAWPLVRAWRFGVDHLRLGGIGEVEPYLDHYNRLTGRNITAAQLFYWEVAGNIRWAIGSLTQARRHLSGQERSVELAVLGRLACEMEYEVLSLIEREAYARPA